MPGTQRQTVRTPDQLQVWREAQTGKRLATRQWDEGDNRDKIKQRVQGPEEGTQVRAERILQKGDSRLSTKDEER